MLSGCKCTCLCKCFTVKIAWEAHISVSYWICDCGQVWFEVSPHTGRVHFHGAESGSRMLGLSLPMELLSLPEEQGTPTTIVELLQALKDR